MSATEREKVVAALSEHTLAEGHRYQHAWRRATAGAGNAEARSGGRPTSATPRPGTT